MKFQLSLPDYIALTETTHPIFLHIIVKAPIFKVTFPTSKLPDDEWFHLYCVASIIDKTNLLDLHGLSKINDQLTD